MVVCHTHGVGEFVLFFFSFFLISSPDAHSRHNHNLLWISRKLAMSMSSIEFVTLWEIISTDNFVLVRLLCFCAVWTGILMHQETGRSLSATPDEWEKSILQCLCVGAKLGMHLFNGRSPHIFMAFTISNSMPFVCTLFTSWIGYVTKRAIDKRNMQSKSGL